MKAKKKIVLPHNSRLPMELFWFLIGISFISLMLYRTTTHFPVWFDEIVMKAFVFGLPLWIFAFISKQKSDFFGFSSRRFWPGAFYGLAAGGLFGFVGMIASELKRGHIFVPSLLSSPLFWNAFGLAFITAWWESVFFYGFIFSTLKAHVHEEVKASILTMVIFVIFHIPILLLTRGLQASIVPMFLLALFAFGQSVIFLRSKSITSVVVSHALWGMVLLVYTL